MDRNRRKKSEMIKRTKENGYKMPTIENVNYEMTKYLQDIGIIDEPGNLSGFYKN